MGEPIVLCAVDWCGIRNDAHRPGGRRWPRPRTPCRPTSPCRCVHPHNAPFADTEAEKLIQEAAEAGPVARPQVLRAGRRQDGRGREGRAGEDHAHHPLSALGKAKVEKVASNRRIIGPDGKWKATRFSATKDAKIRDEPEGLIDPWLRTLSFWNGDSPLAALHYYATHPMSYYGDGRVSERLLRPGPREAPRADTKVFQVYFTGCAGNITAGKYNDGAKENRPVLRDRIARRAWPPPGRRRKRHELTGWQWRVEPVTLPPRKEASFGEEASKKALEDAEPRSRPSATTRPFSWPG